MRALVLVGVAACSFDHGRATQPTISDGAASVTDGKSLDDAMASDAKPVDARVCPPAPTGCIAFTCSSSSSCYYTCGTTAATKASWSGAAGACTNASLGCIVTINNQAEQDCIALATLPSFPNQLVWFGYRQDASGSEPAGGWGWQCGNSSYVHPAWGTFEPNDDGNEDCAVLSNFGGWVDADCSGTARYVCELP